MKITKAVILCGGYETRMLPISKSVPKTMLPVVDKPIIHYIIDELADIGIKQVAFIIDENKDPIRHYFAPNEHLENYLKNTNRDDLLNEVVPIANKMDIKFITRKINCGPGFAISLAREVIGSEPFMLYLSDELVLSRGQSCARQLLDVYEKYNKPVIAVQQVPMQFVNRYGIIDPEKIGNGIYKVKRIVEKPRESEAPSNLSYIGPAILTEEVFEEIENQKKENNYNLVIPYTFRQLFQKGKMLACEIKGKRQDLGNKFGFVKANIEASLERDDLKDKMKEYLKQLVKTF